ncbi:MAG: hypothetical protein AAFS01_07155 [Pseudomonadota bacterium]
MDLDQLKSISALKHQSSQKALADVINRENELRNELDRMRLLTRQTQAQDPEDAQLRAIGGDIIWLKWIAKVQKELNVSLAGILAQKEALLVRHRHETGRKIVAEELANQNRITRSIKKNEAQLQSAILHSLQRPRDQ